MHSGNAWLANVALMFNMSLLLTFLFQKRDDNEREVWMRGVFRFVVGNCLTENENEYKPTYIYIVRVQEVFTASRK